MLFFFLSLCSAILEAVWREDTRRCVSGRELFDGMWRTRRVSAGPQFRRDIKKRSRQPCIPHSTRQTCILMPWFQSWVFLTTIWCFFFFFLIYADCRWGESSLCLLFLRNLVIAEGNKTFIYKHPAVFKMRLVIIF